MAETDSPLKQLVSAFITDFAAWLLHVDVHEAHPLNVELPGGMLTVDQIFYVTLADGRALVLHIEFQGRSSHQPMEWRMLEYMARLGYTHRLALWSVVLYVGHGAGTGDTGYHQLTGPDGSATLSWRYQVVRLWETPAEELLAMARPALLALVGQTHIETPEALLPEVITRLHSVPDVEMRGRLLTALVTLMPEGEMLEMVERLVEREELLLDTPFLRRIRGEGVLMARRQSILEALALRFDPPISLYQPIERYLETVTDEAQLEKLFAAAVRGETLADFQAAM
jgi:predicted transposase YdaD